MPKIFFLTVLHTQSSTFLAFNFSIDSTLDIQSLKSHSIRQSRQLLSKPPPVCQHIHCFSCTCHAFRTFSRSLLKAGYHGVKCRNESNPKLLKVCVETPPTHPTCSRGRGSQNKCRRLRNFLLFQDRCRRLRVGG